jgi:carboxylesterase type B
MIARAFVFVESRAPKEGPMVDGAITPVTPITARTTGRFNLMPMMAGNVQDEQAFFIGNTEYFTGPPQVPRARPKPAKTAEHHQTSQPKAFSNRLG